MLTKYFTSINEHLSEGLALTGIGTCNILIICFPDSITGPSAKRCLSSTSFLRLLAIKICFSIRVALILTAEFPLLFMSNETGINSPKSEVVFFSKTFKTIQFYAQNSFFPFIPPLKPLLGILTSIPREPLLMKQQL
jgi:hypothetical protein